MSKNKHSKYRNTGLMFEFITRKITDDILHQRESTVSPILQKYFSGNSELAKEYDLYRTLVNTTSKSETKAQILIDNIIERFNGLDKNKLDREKYNLVKELKDTSDIKDLFKTKVPNYKLLASINTIMESGYSEEDSTNHMYFVLDHLTATKQSQTIQMDSFLNRPFDQRVKILDKYIEKFNERFSHLSEEQKSILVEYITNSSNSKMTVEFIKSKIPLLQEEINKIKTTQSSNVLSVKLDEVLDILTELSSLEKLQKNHIATMLYIYELVNVLKV